MKNTQFTLCRRIPHNILLYLNLFKFTAWRQFSAIKRLNPIAQSKKRLNRFEEKISYKSIYLWLPILKSLQMIHKYLQARSFSLASNLFFPRKFRSFFFQSLELQCLRFDIWTSLFKKWFDLKIKIRVLVFSDSLRWLITYAKISKDADWHLLEQLHFLIWSICFTISSLPGHLK